jgi:hypothetical protein
VHVDLSTRLSTFPLRLPLRTAALGHKVNVEQLTEDGSLITQYLVKCMQGSYQGTSEQCMHIFYIPSELNAICYI